MTGLNSRRVFIFHGYGGKKGKSWQSWLENELSKLGYKVTFPSLPEFPKIEDWEESIKELIPQINDSIVICHSIGCLLLCYLVQKYDLKIEQSILVACPKNNLNDGKTIHGLLERLPKETSEALKSFVEHSIDWSKIAISVKNITFFYSNDDWAVPCEESMRYYKEFLPNSKFVVLKERGHFNEKTGVFTLPEVLDCVVNGYTK